MFSPFPPPGKLPWQTLTASPPLSGGSEIPRPSDADLGSDHEEVWCTPGRGTLLGSGPGTPTSAAITGLTGGAPGVLTAETLRPDPQLQPSQSNQSWPWPTDPSERWMPGDTPFSLFVAVCAYGSDTGGHACSMHSTYTDPFHLYINPVKWVLLLGSFYKWSKKSDLTCPKPHCWGPARTPALKVRLSSALWVIFQAFGDFCVPYFWVPRFPQEFL